MADEITRRKQVYQYICDQLQEGKITPGDCLSTSDLSRELGVSKTPLREALLRLEIEGFVEVHARKGAVVKGITLDEVKHFFDIIALLESGTLGEVFHLLTDDHLKEMEKLDRKQEEALVKKKTDAYYELNLEWHAIFLELSGNKRLMEIVKPLKRRLYDFPRRNYLTEWELDGVQEHARMIACIRNGNKEGAVSIMRNEHWSFTCHEQHIRMFYGF